MTDTEARRKTEKLSLRLPPRLAARVVDAARSDDRTVSEYVRELLRATVGAHSIRLGGGDDRASS
jgi:predicted HicB family RNase H-like nuclease